MDELITTVAPVMIAGIAIQQILEILDPLVVKIIGEEDKKMVMGLIALVAGLAVSFGLGMRVLQPLGIVVPDGLDMLVSAMVIGAGTEGFNSLLKYIDYAKEGKKGDAAALKAWVGNDPNAREMMRRMDRNRGP
ncbi:MAG: hypothetical protein JW986_01585 [Methanotrichaceae archaeon]|nr:hypothetical protein [Methanotrichaceae archaeon]